jgi:hypothetical protein
MGFVAGTSSLPDVLRFLALRRYSVLPCYLADSMDFKVLQDASTLSRLYLSMPLR